MGLRRQPASAVSASNFRMREMSAVFQDVRPSVPVSKERGRPGPRPRFRVLTRRLRSLIFNFRNEFAETRFATGGDRFACRYGKRTWPSVAPHPLLPPTDVF